MKKMKTVVVLALACVMLLSNIPVNAQQQSVVSAGTEYCAVVDASGNLWTWGYSLRNNLGYKTQEKYSLAPQKVTGDVVSVACASMALYFIKTDNSLWKIGGNIDSPIEPVKVADNVVQADAVGDLLVILTTDGTLKAKGKDSSGILGEYNINGIDYPDFVTITNDVKFVSGGKKSISFIKNDGSLWQKGVYGGFVQHQKQMPMTKVMDDVIDVSTYNGNGYSAAVKADGSMWRWSGTALPVKVDEDVIDVVDGAYLYIKSDNTLWANGVELVYLNESGVTKKLNDKQVASKVLDNVSSAAPGHMFGSYDNAGFYLIARTDGSVNTVFTRSPDNGHGVLGTGAKLVDRDVVFHTPLNVSAKVLENNQISAGGYVPCSFNDVTAQDYYYEPVVWALENGVTAGTSKTTFSPDATCTRGQVLTFLWRAMGHRSGDTNITFSDVSPDDYYYNAVCWAVENAITAGTSETTFSPNDTCNSAQIITFIWRAMGKNRVDAKGTIAEDYADSAYYKDAVAWADSKDALSGTKSAFAPENDAMRCDVVTYLYRILKNN